MNITVSSYGSTEVTVRLTHVVGKALRVQQGMQDPMAGEQELQEIKN